MPSADILLHNILALGLALVLVFFAAFALSRLLLKLLGPILRRIDPSAALHAEWRVQLARIVVAVTMSLGLVLLAGAFILGWYEVDAAAHLRRWVEDSLLRDPRGVALAASQMLGVVVGAATLYFVLSSTLAALLSGAARLPGLVGREAQLDVLLARLRGTLRWTLLSAALVASADLAAAPESARSTLSAVVHVIVAVAVARALAAGAHLVVDVGFDLSDGFAARRGAAHYIHRLRHLAGVTKRALDYCIHVGIATLVCDQLTPGTLLSEAGRAALRVIAILYFSRVIVEVSELAVSELFAARDPALSEAEQQQRRTLIPVASSLLRYAIYIIAIAMALGELGVDTTPLLAAAGLMGIAVGLGAQAIVSDLVSGFFILFEGIFLVGHRVRIGELVGVVEEIGVRMTKLRDETGVLHCIPNGEIRSVASHSQGFVNAVVEFGVPHGEDVARVFGSLREHLADARSRYEDILGETEMVIEELRETSIWIRTLTRVKPGRDSEMSEALRLEIAAALAAAGIAPPHARRIVELRPDPSAATRLAAHAS